MIACLLGVLFSSVPDLCFTEVSLGDTVKLLNYADMLSNILDMCETLRDLFLIVNQCFRSLWLRN